MSAVPGSGTASLHAANNTSHAAVGRIVSFFENMTPANVAELGYIYDTSARFVDPFNDVQGLADIQQIFAHMFVALDGPRFVVTGRLLQDHQCFLTWEFHFRFRRFQAQKPQIIHGGTHLVFSDSGLVTLHRDYWDAAQELYEKLPLVRVLMRLLRKLVNG